MDTEKNMTPGEFVIGWLICVQIIVLFVVLDTKGDSSRLTYFIAAFAFLDLCASITVLAFELRIITGNVLTSLITRSFRAAGWTMLLIAILKQHRNAK